MRHLRLVPPLADTSAGTRAEPDATRYHDPKVALMFFQAASGICLCRDCTKQRHPAYGAR
jgi:hypothetical protein